jgi:hypothetical protein
MKIPYAAILILSCLVSGFAGVFLFLKPALAIKIQIKFYEWINWRIEPISLQKEIRNTRVMGLFLLGMAVATLCFLAGGLWGPTGF